MSLDFLERKGEGQKGNPGHKGQKGNMALEDDITEAEIWMVSLPSWFNS